MNDCIFDWNENCELMLKNKKCTTLRRQISEQIALFRYLIERKYSKNAIFNIWMSINTKITNIVKNDLDEANRHFEKLYQKATKWKIPPRGRNIVIYQKEVEILNNYNITRWLKVYLFALLICYKYYGREWCKLDKNVRTFCFSVTSSGKEKSEYAQKIKAFLDNEHTYDIKLSTSTCLFKMNIAKKSGKVVAKISNPRHIIDVLHLLDYRKICKRCGRKFTVNNKGYKIQICPQCAIFKKREDSHKYPRHKKVNQSTLPNNDKEKD